MSNTEMKVSGGDPLPVQGDETHVRQQPGAEDNWQDSVVLVWWDKASGAGGMHRLGHEPNAPDGGKVVLWNHLVSPEGVYMRTHHKPLRDADRLQSGGFGAGDESCYFEYTDGEHLWTINDPDEGVSGELRATDISGNVDCYPKQGAVADDVSADHFDIPVRVSGEVTMQGKTYAVEGLGIRDHGWGPRDWSSLRSHRWVVGTAGEELSFVFVSWHSVDDSIASFGWVVRGDTVTFAKELDIVAYMELDAASNRGGHVTAELTTGEVLEIECTPVAPAGLCSFHHGVACMDMLCEFTCGDIHGVGNFETTSNLQGGTRRPEKFSNALIDDGFHAVGSF